MTPEIVTGISLLAFFQWVFRWLGWHLGLFTVILAHVSFSIAYVAIVVAARLRTFDPALEEAAMDLGATEWRAFWRVTLPALTPGIVAAALLALTISFDDYVITSLVAGVDSTTLPMVIYALARRGANPFDQRHLGADRGDFRRAHPDLRALEGSVKRRHFLFGALACTAACRRDRRPRLNVYNWSAYVAPDTIPNFEKEFGVRVRYVTYESNEEMLAQVISGNSGWDIVFPTHNRVPPMSAMGLLAPLDQQPPPEPAQSRSAVPIALLGPRVAMVHALHVVRHRASPLTVRLSRLLAPGPTSGARASRAGSPCSTIPRT